jgi:hypothetical protein
MEKYHTYSTCKEGIYDFCFILLGISKKLNYHFQNIKQEQKKVYIEAQIYHIVRFVYTLIPMLARQILLLASWREERLK